MNDMPLAKAFAPLDPRKFKNPDLTADGSERAFVGLERLDTLWVNTGTLCNITCANCYIESSPSNDRLAYMSRAEANGFYREIRELGLGTREIAFTGGEPFLNPDMIGMAEDALVYGFKVLILTNAMQPMQRKRLRTELLRLRQIFGGQLTLRVSLDHFTKELHDQERGAGSFTRTLAGADWLSANGFSMSVAGRTRWDEPEEAARAGYRDLFRARGWQIDADDPSALMLFPEMDAGADVPEITTDCWGLLGIRPQDVMCATSRMVVKRKGSDRPTVLPCTLLPYDMQFEMAETLEDSLRADGGMFRKGAVSLCHPHCAKFCVLGGGSCSKSMVTP